MCAGSFKDGEQDADGSSSDQADEDQPKRGYGHHGISSSSCTGCSLAGDTQAACYGYKLVRQNVDVEWNWNGSSEFSKRASNAVILVHEAGIKYDDHQSSSVQDASSSSCWDARLSRRLRLSRFELTIRRMTTHPLC